MGRRAPADAQITQSAAARVERVRRTSAHRHVRTLSLPRLIEVWSISASTCKSAGLLSSHRVRKKFSPKCSIDLL